MATPAGTAGFLASCAGRDSAAVAGPDAVVVGGGPGGLMAAEVLAGAGASVTVYERMPSVGRKLLLAGRGGLNLTHTEPLAQLLGRYGTAEGRLAEAIRAFPPDDVRAWCAGLGQETFVGSSGRVFPEAFRATPLLRAWLARLDGLGVRIRVRTAWRGWSDDGALLLDGPGGEERRRPEVTVLALGGASWPRVGSDGRWVQALEGAGVAVTPLRPANCGFRAGWSPVFRERFAGASLKNVRLSHRGASVRGDTTITTDGVEGGPVHVLSAGLRDAIEAEGSAALGVDLHPDLSLAALQDRLARARPGDSRATALRRAGGLQPVAIGLLRETTANRLPAGPGALARAIKGVEVTLLGTAPLARAISTAGGVALDEVDGAFMLRRRPGTFVVGEMLDWEAPTGGYLLQATLATAVRAARAAVKMLAEGGGQGTD
jgi:uncharacterized flavoprotein (TIGR03862 family)